MENVDDRFARGMQVEQKKDDFNEVRRDGTLWNYLGTVLGALVITNQCVSIVIEVAIISDWSEIGV